MNLPSSNPRWCRSAERNREAAGSFVRAGLPQVIEWFSVQDIQGKGPGGKKSAG